MKNKHDKKPKSIITIALILLFLCAASTLYFKEEFNQIIQSTEIILDWHQEKEYKEVKKLTENAKTDTSSLKELIRLAGSNNPFAQVGLGLIYEKGLGGIPIDERKARELYEKSAAQGNQYGQYNLGVMYRSGQGGLPKDEKKARELYEKSAAQGNLFAQNSLGVMYRYGEGGLPKDLWKAVELYEKSAAQGDSSAQNNLGIMYQDGKR